MASKRIFLDLTDKKRENVEQDTNSVIDSIHNKLVEKLKAEATKYENQEKILQEGFNELKTKYAGVDSETYGNGYFEEINNNSPVFKRAIHSLQKVPTNEYKRRTQKLGDEFEDDVYNYLLNIFNGIDVNVTKPAKDIFYTQSNNLTEEVINDLYESLNNKQKKQTKDEFIKRIGLKLSQGSIYSFNAVTNPKVDVSVSGIEDITFEGELSENQKKFKKALVGVNFQIKNRKKLVNALGFGNDTISRRFEKFYSVITSIGYEPTIETALKIAFIDNSKRKNDNVENVKKHTPHLKAYYEVIGPLQSTGQVNMILYNNSEDISKGVLVRSAAGYVLDYIEGENNEIRRKHNIDFFKGINSQS